MLTEIKVDDMNFDWSKQFPLYRISYYDHCWIDEKNPENVSSRAKPYLLQELGYIIKEEKNYYVLCHAMSFSGEKNKWEFDKVSVIMKSNLYKLEELKIQKKEKQSGNHHPSRK